VAPLRGSLAMLSPRPSAGGFNLEAAATSSRLVHRLFTDQVECKIEFSPVRRKRSTGSSVFIIEALELQLQL
jgi:hypothetical protein